MLTMYETHTHWHPYKKIMPRTHVAICQCTMTHSCVSWHIHTWMTDSTKHVTLIRRVHSLTDVTKNISIRHKSNGTGYCTTRNKKEKNACKNPFTLRSSHKSFPDKRGVGIFIDMEGDVLGVGRGCCDLVTVGTLNRWGLSGLGISVRWVYWYRWS